MDSNKISKNASEIIKSRMQANREIIKSRMQANCIILVKKTQVTRCHAMRARYKDRWTKRGVNWAFFQNSKTNKATLTYAKLVRLNSPTG